VPDAAGSQRAQLLKTIEDRRACIDAYLQEEAPRSKRLTNITIVSGALAAALTAGPAFGGAPFTEDVQQGLSLEEPQTVWRGLCFAALAVSLAAVISTNLSRARDLPAHIAGAEAADAMLHRLQTRLNTSDPSAAEAAREVEEAAKEYGDIVAGIPFVRDLQYRRGARQRPAPAHGRPLVTPLAAVAAAGTLVLLATLVGYGIGLGRTPSEELAGDATSAATPGATAPESPSAGPSPTPVEEEAGVFAGKADALGATLAIVVDGDLASAYLCDGRQLEAWLDGKVVEGAIDMTSPGGARLTGTVTEEVVSGEVEVGRLSTSFRADRAGEPAGVYEANIEVNGAPARIGWAVLPNGEQVGIVNREGVKTEAPTLNTERLVFTYQGAEYPAIRKGP
jgi:hypothetical protein